MHWINELPISKRRMFLVGMAISLLLACAPAGLIRKSVEEALSLTQTAAPTPSATLTSTASLTPSHTPTVTSTPTITLTPTATMTPTLTATPTITVTVTSSVTPTPSPTLTPTATPVLPELSSLVIDIASLNASADLWQGDPEDLQPGLQELNGVACEIDCTGLRWTSKDLLSTLTLIIYRAANPQEALLAIIGAQNAYLDQKGFTSTPISPDSPLPAQTWFASRKNREFVIFTTEGPAIASFFWQSQEALDVDDVMAFLSTSLQIQSSLLKQAGY